MAVMGVALPPELVAARTRMPADMARRKWRAAIAQTYKRELMRDNSDLPASPGAPEQVVISSRGKKRGSTARGAGGCIRSILHRMKVHGGERS